MTGRRTLLLSALSLPLASLLTATPTTAAQAAAPAAPQSFYVDCGAAAAGDGTQATPWNALAQVNSHTFQPGDSILLRRGSTCTGQTLFPKGSGAAGAPVVVDAYGTGAKPALAGAGQVTDVVRLADQQYWEVRNLDISNKGAAAATRRGIHVTRTDSGTGTYYRLTGLDVHDVNGNQTKKDDDASAGIFFEVLGNTTPTKFDDVALTGNTVRAVDRYGIHFWTRWMRRPELANANCGTTCGAWTPQTRVVIRGNTVSDIGGDAIVPHHTEGALLEYNKVDGFREREPAHCAAGLWGWNTQDTLYQFNEVSGGKSTCDGQGLDLDEGNIRTIYQYNYSHDNEGGFILLCNGGGSTTADNIVRYNISQNDGGQLFDMVCARTTNTQIHNNTFYLSKPVEIISNSNGSTAANATFTNNVFHVATDSASYVNAAGLGYDANVFYGAHPAGEPADAHKVTADPKLTAPGTATSRTDVDGYRLQAGSSALANGAVVANAGARDYFGGPVAAGCVPDRGAHQSSTTCVKPTGPMAGVNRISAGTQAIDVPAHSTAQGTQLVGWLWNGGDNQRWNVTADTDGTYTLKNVTSGLCAEVYQNSKAAGAAIDQWACSGDANQRWSATPVTGGYRLTSKSSGLLLTAASTTNGAPLTQQAPSTTAVQTWAFTKLS
ncbi:RICIN domain-containing protein [Streptomyces sp. NBC_00184]|uniref:RICIN domain-containing protein n=1 Tax=Streptomyces sp. NBC_00184 TaxID=2975673 RepID=UPI002E28F437|nr:RICIN domain-containing protein [Streptomyces sp. NBC_00184]